MPVRKANAVWNGSLKEGSGQVNTQSGAVNVKYSFGTRFEETPGTNPEELIAAAHAGCFSMALSAGLGKSGHKPERIATSASVTLEKVGEAFGITRILLQTEGKVPGIDEKTFIEHAEKAKAGCPVSKALGGTEIKLEAKLLK
jgi:lipoyl-dependent peroxiredoxin